MSRHSEQGPGPWITARNAAKILGTTEYSVYRRSLLGHIRARIRPGEHLQFHREDVEFLADHPHRPAQTPVSANSA